MSWKKQSSRTNTGNNTFVNSNYSLSTNLISEESKILGKGLFYNDVDICGNLTVGGTLDVSNIDIELLTIENMEVSGNLLVKGTLGVSGDVDFSNNLFVAGDISCNGELHFADLTYDNLTVENKLDVSGLDISNNLSIKGTISGDYLFVDGDRIHIGKDAGQINQGENAVAIGNQAGYQNQQEKAVAIGYHAGYQNQQKTTVAIGNLAGWQHQNQYSVAIGVGAGQQNQNQYSVAIGHGAGAQVQNQYSVAIGHSAGAQVQNQYSVAIGHNAGYYKQNQNSVAIGYRAGHNNQNQYAVAIGYRAGDQDQSANSIILNAQDVSLNCDSSGLFIAPIRDLGVGSSDSLFYNATTKEVFYSTSGGGGSTFSDVTITNQLDVSGVDISNNLFVAGDISCNGNLFVAGTELGAVVEKFHYYCSGQTHTLKAGGTTSITDVTASQTLLTSYATITGSSLAYTPPSGASQVNYKFTFAYRGEDATSIIFIKCFLDGTEITVARNTFRFQGNFTESERIIEVPITINGASDDIPNATVNTWSSSKTFHIETRDYDSDYDVTLHSATFFRTGDGATGEIGPLFIKPMVEITAIKF